MYKILRSVWNKELNSMRYALSRTSSKTSSYRNVHRTSLKISQPQSKNKSHVIISYMGILTYFGFSRKKEENEENLRDKTVKLIKMAILSKQEGKFDISEQLLHLALKSAQEQMDYNAVTYIYDEMANLALEAGNLTKAETLFKDVSQRLVSSGMALDDAAIIEISIKLAGIYSQLDKSDEAESGFDYSFKQLDNKLKLEPNAEDEDLRLLLAMCADAFGKHLMKLKKFSEAEKYFARALDIYSNVNGLSHPQSLVLLNNLGSACGMAGNFSGAVEHLSLAITNAKASDCDDISAFYRNMGMVQLQMGELAQAEHYCRRAAATSKDNHEHKVEAQNCLQAIRQAKEST